MNNCKLMLWGTLFSFLLCAAPLTVCAQEEQQTETSAQQQEPKKKKSKFGSILRKMGEATTGINMSNELFTVIPPVVKRNFDIEVVGCYGDRDSETVTLIFIAKSKKAKADFRVGSIYGSDKAYDSKGTTFDRTGTRQVSQDCPVGVPVKYELAFKGVPGTLKALELISLNWWMSAGSDKGHSNSDTPNMEFRNVPILWDVVPE